MRKLSLIRLLLSFVFAVGSCTGQQAQDQPAASAQNGKSDTDLESATVLKVTTRMVMLEVVATDGHGHPVTDLAAKDFTVLEEGKPQAVRAFGFQRPAPYDPKFRFPALSPHVFTNIPQFPPASSLNVIVLDAMNTTIPNQAYVREKMLHYLETMPTNQPMAVYALSQKLRMVQDFTTDPNALREAIHKAGMRSSPLLNSPSGGQEAKFFPPGYLDSETRISPEAIQAIQDFEAEETSFKTDLRVEYTLDALLALAHSLSGYQCRKNLIWVTEAFPIFINPKDNGNLSTFAGARNYDREIAKVAQVLTDSQIAIYPVDARGLGGPDYFSASNDSTDALGRSISGGTQMTNALAGESDQLFAAHAAMDSLAQETGGKAYYNRNDIDGAIHDSVNDGSTYYTLGYYPEDKNWNGKFRKLQVKVDHPGIKLRYRPGYYATDSQNKTTEELNLRNQELNDALNFDHPNATELFFRADLAPSEEKARNKIGLNYRIDPHAVSFERGSDGLERASVDCVVQAYDTKGKLVNSVSNTEKSALHAETYNKVLQSAYPCQNLIDLPDGDYLLRLAVRDNRSGLIGTTTGKLTVPLPQSQLVRRQ